MKNINLKSKVRKFITVTFNDEEGTVIQVLTPTKSLMDQLMSMEELAKDSNAGNKESLDFQYDLCSQILSRNLNNKKISKEKLESTCDMDDLKEIFEGYLEFLREQMNGKN